MDNKLVNIKTIRRRRSECSWKKGPINNTTTSLKHLHNESNNNNEIIEYPPGPIHIVSSWNPVNRADKPPYSYATIIGHAILTSKERKLTLNDIYVWITENYPFYSNDTQGWQNSIRHNLSLHKAFVKIDRDSTTQNPPRKGCFWTIRQGKEKSFIDNLQKPVNSVRKHHSLSHIASSTSSAAAIARRQQQQQRRSSVLTTSSHVDSTTDTTANSIHHNNGLFNTFRATVIPTHTVTTNLLPESEPIVITSSSSSSDHNHSPITSSNTSSPTYHQLLMPSTMINESNTTYQVYPDENHELFGGSAVADDLQSYTYSTTSGASYLTDHQPPSLSSCDAYSTTSSSFADNHHQQLFYGGSRGSQDYSSRMYSTSQTNLFYKGYNTSSGYTTTSYLPYNNMMDWTSAKPQESSPSSSLKHDNLLYNNNTISPPYFYLQQQQQSRLGGSSGDFSSFLHR